MTCNVNVEEMIVLRARAMRYAEYVCARACVCVRVWVCDVCACACVARVSVSVSVGARVRACAGVHACVCVCACVRAHHDSILRIRVCHAHCKHGLMLFSVPGAPHCVISANQQKEQHKTP